MSPTSYRTAPPRDGLRLIRRVERLSFRTIGRHGIDPTGRRKSTKDSSPLPPRGLSSGADFCRFNPALWPLDALSAGSGRGAGTDGSRAGLRIFELRRILVDL